MGDANEGLDLSVAPPAVVLMAGLQGSGKTTSVAKLARWLQERHKKSVMVVSCDVYRPAAIDQLETLAGEVGASFHPSRGDQDPLHIARGALEAARKQFKDVLIVDTAGRLHVDADMMEEIRLLHGALSPVETLFVVDSMTGQDAANTAKAFNDALPLSGVVLTKADGDARGGAALSIRLITGKPINSMTPQERTFPAVIKGARKRRIALGSGTQVQDVNRLLKQFTQMQKMMKKMKGGGMARMLRGLKGRAPGGMPPGGFPF